jgi:hypothetical protein
MTGYAEGGRKKGSAMSRKVWKYDQTEVNMIGLVLLAKALKR